MPDSVKDAKRKGKADGRAGLTAEDNPYDHTEPKNFRAWEKARFDAECNAEHREAPQGRSYFCGE